MTKGQGVVRGAGDVPEPRAGGTWLYCPAETTDLTADAPVVGATEWCTGGPPSGRGPRRFRTASAYRRHYRRQHGRYVG